MSEKMLSFDASAADIGQPEQLNQLIDGLLKESFAIENGFAELNLDKINHVLEESAPMFEATEHVPQELMAQKNSYDRCKDAYCLLLLHLEGSLGKLPTAPLSELRQGEAPAPPPPAPETNPVMQSFNDDLPPLLDAPGPGETTLPGIIMARPPEPFEVPEPLGSGFDSLPTLGSMDSISLEPPPESKHDHEHERERDHDHEHAPAPEHAADEPTPVPKGLHSPQGIEYFRLADYFQQLKNHAHFPFPSEYADRLSLQYLCFAVEAECIEKMATPIAAFWAHREHSIRALLDNQHRRFDLHPTLKKAVDQLADAHPDWLYDQQFPYAGVLNSLRFMIATTRVDRFKPTAIETAVLLFFFGNDQHLGGFPLSNSLGVKGLTLDELVELTFRLSRVQKLKNRVVTAGAEFEPAQLELLQEDTLRILDMLSKMGFNDESKRAA